MKNISMTIHKWLGLVLSLWLLLITFTGTALLFKNDLLQWQYPQLEQDGRATQKQALKILESDAVSSIAKYSFAPTDLHPWVEVIDQQDARLYYSKQGKLLLSREEYGDWISWFVQFHHHLLLDETGEDIQGILGLLTIVIFITGLIKWWPKGRFQKRDLSVTMARPGKKKWGQTLWQSHRTLGVILFLPMLLLILTGIGMIYYAAFNTGLNAIFPQHSTETRDYAPLIEAQNERSAGLADDWVTRSDQVASLMPDIRTIMVYHDQDRLRLRQPEQWHPNGRSYVSFRAGTSQITSITDSRNETLGTQISQKIYPLHIASVGGLSYLTVATISGVSLIWVCISGFWFWLWCRKKKKSVIKKH